MAATSVLKNIALAVSDSKRAFVNSDVQIGKTIYAKNPHSRVSGSVLHTNFLLSYEGLVGNDAIRS